MTVKLAVTLTFIFWLLALTDGGKEICRQGSGHKLTQVTCANFVVEQEWLEHIPTETNLEKFVIKNVTGPLDLSNITLNSLRYLVVSNSRIDDISLGIFPELIFVTFLKNRKFPNLTEDLFLPATHINWLSLVSNNHTITSSAFHLLKNLTWLHIQNQKLENLTGEFLKENTKLHELAIRNCHLQQIDCDAFDATIELEILSLNFNNLKYFQNETFKNLHKLKILELHHNRFTFFNLDQFSGLHSLEVLGLPSVFLKTVKADELLSTFPNLKKVEMKKKDMKRNAETKKLIKELRRAGIDIIGTPHDCHGSFTTCNIV